MRAKTEVTRTKLRHVFEPEPVHLGICARALWASDAKSANLLGA